MTTAVITTALNPWVYRLHVLHICTFVILVSNVTYNRAALSHNWNLPHSDGFRNPFVKAVFMHISVLRHDLWISCAECFWAHTQHVLITRRKRFRPHVWLAWCSSHWLLFTCSPVFFVLLKHSHNEYKWFVPYAALSMYLLCSSHLVQFKWQKQQQTIEQNSSTWTVTAKTRSSRLAEQYILRIQSCPSISRSDTLSFSGKHFICR